MPMPPPTPLSDFLRWLHRLHDAATEDGALILVEGERDRVALVELRIPTEAIVLVNGGRTLTSLGEDLIERGRPVIILTDLDGEGGRLARRITEVLRDGRLDVDLTTRRQFSSAVRREISEIEALHAWAERAASRERARLEDLLAPLS